MNENTTTITTDRLLGEWRRFYVEYFGLEDTKNFLHDVHIPATTMGFRQLIVVPERLTLNQAYAVCESKFTCSCHRKDLGAAVTENSRLSTREYAVWIRHRRIEADEELHSLSVNALIRKKVVGITLLERLLYELFYFWKTGRHLDIDTITLCSGSRYSGGGVPFVNWDKFSKKMCVGWLLPSQSQYNLRAREVVS